MEKSALSFQSEYLNSALVVPKVFAISQRLRFVDQGTFYIELNQDAIKHVYI